MKRKVIKQANQAFTITLPIEWVRKNKINQNSEVEISDEGKSLVIINNKEIEKTKAKLNADTLNQREISRTINSFYARGIDEIEISSKSDISSNIVSSLRHTIGYALVSQEKEIYSIQDMGGTNYSDLDGIFKRVFQMVLLFYESAITDIFGKEKETIESLISRDTEVNKFCLYLQRAINKMSYPKAIDGRILFTYSFALEKIGDEIQRMWRTNVKYKIKKTPQIQELMKISFEGLSKAFDFYYQFKLSTAGEIYKLREEVRTKSLNLLKINPPTARFVRHIVKIIEDAADLSHLTLMMKA